MRRLPTALLFLGTLSACSSGFGGKGDDPEGKRPDNDNSESDTDTDTDTDTDPPGPDDIDDDGDGLTENEGDCDDTSADASPDNDEIPYDGIDNDCDDSTPDDDLDGDGVLAADDCDDTDADASPDNAEVPYDGIDNDCDSSTPDDDLDSDGADLADDCDDTDPDIGPDMSEIPYDGVDNDCDSSTPDDDLDKDGFLLEEDCDDTDPLVYPGADEDHTNGVDDDCDGLTDERFDYDTIDSSCDCGAPSAIATDSAGQVWLAYRDADIGELKYDLRTTGGSWSGSTTISTSSSSGYDVGLYLDAEVDSADYFNVAYTSEDLTAGYWKLDYQYADPSGSFSSVYEVDGPSTTGSYYVGEFVDLAMDSSNLPTFGYYDAFANLPYVADFTSFGVAVYSLADISTSASYYQGVYTSLALDSSDFAHMVFLDAASPFGFGWSPETQYSSFDTNLGDACISETVASDGIYNSIALKSDDTPCVAYQDATTSDLYYACNTGDCDGWNVELVASTGAVGSYASLGFNSNDEPYIAYYDETNKRLMMAHDDGTGFTTFVVDESASVGTYADLAIDPSDNVHVSYYDADANALKYAVGR